MIQIHSVYQAFVASWSMNILEPESGGLSYTTDPFPLTIVRTKLLNK